MKCNGTGHHAKVGVEAHWSLEQVNALTHSFLSDCLALESAGDEQTKLDLIRQVMRHHVDNVWSNTEVLALEGSILYYRGRLLDKQLSSSDRTEILKRIYTDKEPEWMEAEIIRLQFILLDSCASLADPECPLAEKLDLLRWLLADETHAYAPFSFHRCARSAWGSCDVSALREALIALVPSWVRQSIDRYPVEVRSWVWDELVRDPAWLSERLDINPQFLNEQAKALGRQPDLFAASA